MDMHIDSNLIRAEREKLAWSQEQLAEVANLSLRTVQRIEGTGRASFESVRAVSSVLSIPVTRLRIPEQAEPKRTRFFPAIPKVAAVGAAFAACLLSVALVRSAFAEQIRLDVELSLGAEDIGSSRIVTKLGEDAEFWFGGVWMIVIRPTVMDDGLILIEAKFYEQVEQEPLLRMSPSVATTQGRAARFAWTDRVVDLEQGQRPEDLFDLSTGYNFRVTPSLE